MFDWMKLLTRDGRAQRRHDQIIKAYKEYATRLGDGLSYTHLGQPILDNLNIHEQYHTLDAHEEAYASLGYRIVRLNRWIDHGGYAVPIDDVWLVARKEGERPIFTKSVEKIPEFPRVSPLVDLFLEHPGKTIQGFLNDDGEMEYEVID